MPEVPAPPGTTLAPVGRGPVALGRGIVVPAGAGVPDPWQDCDRVLVDPEALERPRPVVERLHEAWSTRQPVVVELAVDPAVFRRPRSITAQPWELSADFELWHDRLQFLVWNNNYDARIGRPIWWWARKAARLGATLVEGALGDVELDGATAAWIDGGPSDDVEASAVAPARLIRAETVEAGALDPVPDWTAPAAALADDQLAAVAHRGGPARIIAPAGSGKTRVLTERLRHVLADRGLRRDQVVAVAYNRKAQEEMAARTEGLGARIRTLNALGYEIVGRHAGTRPRLLDEREVRDRLERLLPRLPRRLNTDPMAPYLDALSTVRLGLADPEDVEVAADVPGLAEAVAPYRDGLRRDGVLDFDEQILRAVEVLLADGEFRAAEQARHRHLLVDEFQDLTPAHVLLLRLLATPTFSVFGVGDDDQVIYGHAGASPRFLVEFDQLFPGAAHHALETNYRCPAAVVDAARALLEQNRARVPKQIRAAAGPAVAGALHLVLHPPEQGAARLVETVARAATAGPGDVAVLTRTNSLLLAPHVALREAGVPVDSVLRRDVLDRVGLRAALAWLRVALDPGNIAPGDLVEVRRRPSRGFPTWVDKWLARCRSSHEVARAASRVDDLRVSGKLVDLAADIDRLAALSAGATTRTILAAIRDDIGLGGAMELLDGRPGAEGSSHLDDLDALAQVADLQPDPERFESWLRHALADPGPGGETGVTLSTVHRVKGREWPQVVVFGADAGLFPHRLADDVEEERRVFHVAITRGIDGVTVLADDDRPSPFLWELGPSALPGPAPTTAAPKRAEAVASPARTSGDRRPLGAPDLDGDDLALFERLRTWRAEVSRRQGGPAFTVFADSTLAAIARARPTDLRSLRAIRGVGPSKLESYGDDVLELVAGPA